MGLQNSFLITPFIFIFQLTEAAIVTDNDTNILESTNTINEATKFTSSYWIGVGLAFTFATTGNYNL